MFTGIVETLGTVINIEKEGTNVHFTIETDLAKESYIDQSISHNGVCLTVVSIRDDSYIVTAIQETLKLTNLRLWQVGDRINIERAMTADKRMDGHFVQGHVDGTVQCTSVEDADGSWNYRFTLPFDKKNLIVSKGSVTLNGISLTVVDPDENSFGVSIIPYTYEYTTMKNVTVGSTINIEYDMIAKHIAKNIDLYMDVYLNKSK